MTSGVRAAVRVREARTCPLATLPPGASARTVGRTVDPDEGRLTEEFEVDTDAAPDVGNSQLLEQVFSYNGHAVYRYERSADRPCPCLDVERFDCPVVNAYACEGDLHLVVNVGDVEGLRRIVSALDRLHGDVEIVRLLRSDADEDPSDVCVVDRSRLTDRQEEVLETAHEMGYFERQGGSNATDVAREMGISRQTVLEHLSHARRKLFGSLVG
ncbi:MAG: helix-turn-helix domain-containing protein [Halodesulfurarchaeum sp.]